MNPVIIELTLRQLISKRRTLMLVLAALIPVLIAVAYRLAADTDFTISQDGIHSAHQEWAASTLLANLVLATLLPLAALVFGTAALGSEIEDGTAVYLLSKPIPRWKVLVSKLLVAWLITAAFITAVTVAGGAIALAGQPTELTRSSGDVINVGSGYGIIFGFAVATIVGSLVYAAVFVSLSVATSRALVVGLIYVFLWEGVVTRLFTGTRVFSVRQYTFALAEELSGVAPGVFEARLGFSAAVLMVVLVTAAAVWYGVQRLQRFEIGEAA
ncbi:MAG: ABC transporter permease [Dehalococcoidia bacterium]|nr:ABC transporter permease [Dehalococcoidia bacterium]